MAEGQKYLIRDPQGNVYGPADAVLLREWVAQGRIVPGMAIAPRETREWVEASVHPETARAIAARLAELQAATGAPPGVGQPAEVNEGPSGPETFSGITTGEESPNAREQPAGQIQPVQVEMVSASEILPGEGVDLESAVRSHERALRADLGYAAPARQNVLGVLSLIFGSLSLLSSCGTCGCVLLFPVSGLIAVTAITLGSIALWQINAQPVAYTGRGMAISGICLGSLTLVLYVVLFIFAFGSHLMSKP